MATPVTAPVPTEPTTLSLQVATTKWLVTFLQCPDSLRGDSSNDSQYSRYLGSLLRTLEYIRAVADCNKLGVYFVLQGA